MKLLDPKLVKFQCQVSTISQGYDAADYFTKYPGPFISMHLQGWSARTKKTVPVGLGTLDWTKIFTGAKVGGIRNYFVEMDPQLMAISVPYLRKLQAKCDLAYTKSLAYGWVYIRAGFFRTGNAHVLGVPLQ